ncbi:unnamed protein product [Schistocephalus solidus]|uniref:L-lactate dehydrogenase n=1 Tax=Schistocephalus solidus TaxID=70667 RepID=A0A183T6W5_SCHSO|nr:unnamed protein product [Schistocephalus solidus]
MSEKHQICIPIANDIKSKPKTKVTVVGVGSVGMAIAFTVMTKVRFKIICKSVVRGKFLDFSYSAHSDVVFIAAGARQKDGESRLNLIQRNLEIFKCIVPEIVKHSPNCVIVVVSNPVDILTHITWKLSGFPQNRVLGSGTVLDSARFRHILGEKLNLAASSIHGYIIGEHGDSSVAVWSKVSIGGVHLATVYPKMGEDDDPDHFADIHKSVVESAYEIIRLKGYTSWAIGLGCANLCHALVNDRHVVLPVSTNVKGLYGIDYDCFLSIPSVINSSGVTSVINLSLKPKEIEKLHRSAKTLDDIFKGLKW